MKETLALCDALEEALTLLRISAKTGTLPVYPQVCLSRFLAEFPLDKPGENK